QHPGIVPVHDWGQLPDGRLYFTMQQVQGHTMAALLRELHDAQTSAEWNVTASGLSLTRLVDVLRRAAEAVGFAHSRKTIHCDLKPENIMIGQLGDVKVMDWGVAVVSNDQKKGHATPSFMAPEQADEGEVTCATDVYALGVLLHCILIGRPV